MKIVCISDTHGQHRALDIPEGDVLVHAGDITRRGERETVEDFAAWLKELPHPHKLVVPGNHDFCFDVDHSQFQEWARPAILESGAKLLADSMFDSRRTTVIDGVRFHGFPWVTGLPLWAFNVPDESKWFDIIPYDTEVLISHGPPFGRRDWAEPRQDMHSGEWLAGRHIGSVALRTRIAELRWLKLLVCGHVHDSYGVDGARQSESEEMEPIIVNACSCNGAYRPENQPIVIDLPDEI